MARYLIEVPHEANFTACSHAVEVFMKTGSHFLTHADFGCADGEHKAWLTVEVDSRTLAKRCSTSLAASSKGTKVPAKHTSGRTPGLMPSASSMTSSNGQ